jgi:hypothetical protein
VEAASSLRERRRSTAIERHSGSRLLGVAEAATLRFVQGTTVVARKMQELPVPKPGPTERVALGAAAAQLRALANVAIANEAESPVDHALSELVRETLALVDRVLEEDPTLPKERRSPALPESTEEVVKVRF